MGSQTQAGFPDRLLLGVAYYPEYLCESASDIPARARADLALMREAGMNVIRVGESVWSTWEPRDGEFDLDWLEPVLDEAAKLGIGVVLGTPTYAVPPWLQVAHPEIAAERQTGQRIPWGARQEVDYSHPTFRRYAERVIRAIVGRYARHPVIIGYQLDNEPGLELFHNDHVFGSFLEHLRDRYGDAQTLNREWGLTYWSHRITDFSQLWRPDGNSLPQYDLAWRRFQAELTTDFIRWQANIVDEYRLEGQLVTTCLQYPRRGVAEDEVGRVLDVAAGNPYYGMQDHLDATCELQQPNYWTTTGVPRLFRQADRIFATKQQRFWVTETNAQTIDGSHFNCPPYPGQLRQAAYAFISRGAAMVEYWHWHSIPFGTETYWGGVLPHSLQPGRVYAEVAAIGAELAAIDPSLRGYEPDADVALLWSTPSRYALQFMPPLNDNQSPDGESYEHIVDSFYRGVVESGRQARILHVWQAAQLGGEELARRFPVLIAAATYVVSDADLELLVSYAEHGGHLVLGPRTAYADEEARARVSRQPAGLAQVAGTWYEEFSNVDADITVKTTGNGAFAVGSSAAGMKWIDGLIPDGAQILASYEHPRFGDFAAVTTRRHGQGRVTMVGCLPNAELSRNLIEWVAPFRRQSPFGRIGLPVTAASGQTGNGSRVWFVFNWSWDPQCLEISSGLAEIVSGKTIEPGTELSLGPWAATALLEQ